MRLYLDDDSAEALLVSLLRREGHDVQVPADVVMVGQSDAKHLIHAVREDRALLSRNHDDFRILHELIAEVRGHYPGSLMVRRDNDASRDMKPGGIVRAIRNLLAAGVPIRDQFHILNHWR
jgi:hypothetical protein